MATGFLGLSSLPSPAEIARVVNRMLTGGLNVTGSVTLRAGQTTTTISDPRIGGNSVILLSPTTSNAAGAVGTTYVSSTGAGTATLTHASAASTDRTFRYVVMG